MQNNLGERGVVKVGESKVDYEEMCRCLLTGLHAARNILEETETRCQELFDKAVAEEIENAADGEDRHEILQRAATKKMKLWKK